MLIIGIDLSMTGTGIVSLIDGKLDKSKLIETKLEGKGLSDRMSRIKKILNEITEFTNTCFQSDNPGSLNNLIVIEGYSFASRTGMAFSIGELGGIIRCWMAESITDKKFSDALEIPPTQLKKFVTGKGNVDKNLMLKEAFKKFHVDFDDDNICDAFCLAYMTWCYYVMKNKLPIKLNLDAKQIEMLREFIVAESNKELEKGMAKKRKTK